MLAPTISNSKHQVPRFVIAEAADDADIGYTPYGGSRELWYCRDHEVVISGPAETGKTLSCLHKLDTLAWKYPGMRGLIVRRTYQSAIHSVIVTYERKVLGAWNSETGKFDQALTPVKKYGGERPEWYDYPNGSRLVVAGIDKPGKALSSEYDVIYVNQAEELDIDDWETLATRCTGRAGNMPYAQLMGDCNPAHPQHWLLARRDEGALTFIESRHRDNPTLYDPETGAITAQGKATMAVLDALTGPRKLRLRDGLWVQAEGVVYAEFDPAIHLVDEAWDAKRVSYYIASVDWGYTHAGVLQVWAVDGDGRMARVHEVYRTQKTDDWWLAQAEKLNETFHFAAMPCDPSEPAYITKFRRAGLPAVPAFNSVMPGITAVKERLQPARDGRPRLVLVRSALGRPDESLMAEKKPTCTEQEVPVYVWNDNTKRDEPVKENDHGADCMRYAVAYVDRLGRAAEKKPRSYQG